MNARFKKIVTTLGAMAVMFGSTAAGHCASGPAAMSLDYAREPVIFLPEQNDLHKVNPSQGNKIRKWIDAHLEVVATLGEQDEMQDTSKSVSFCMGTSKQCEPLVVWESKTKSYQHQVFLDTGKTTHLSMIPEVAVIERLKSEISDGPKKFALWATIEGSTEPVQIGNINVVNLE